VIREEAPGPRAASVPASTTRSPAGTRIASWDRYTVQPIGCAPALVPLLRMRKSPRMGSPATRPLVSVKDVIS
jgi:hypothetical protein